MSTGSGKEKRKGIKSNERMVGAHEIGIIVKGQKMKKHRLADVIS